MSEHKGPASEPASDSQRGQSGTLRSKAPPKPRQRPRPKLHRHRSLATDVNDDDMLGRTLAGRYLVEGVLGRGTMGVVYSCRHLVLERSVAIKILKPDMAQDEEVLQRFMTEAKAASSIGSQHIVDVLDFGRLADGSSYLVMEQLSGQTLGELLAASPLLPTDIVLSLALQIAEGLRAAHAAGVVHRDLKPDNVFLTETRPDEYFVTILDFGIAKVQASQNKLTQQGTLVGTPHYMSPEQASATAADQRADIYSLGVIMFELATGDVPFDGETPVAVLTQHVHDKPPTIASRLPEGRSLPAGLESVIRKCLAKRPEHRYQSMSELSEDLKALISGSAPEVVIETEAETPPESAPVSVRVSRGLRPLFYVALVGAALLGAAWGTREYLAKSASMPTIVTVAAPPPPAVLKTEPKSQEPEGTKVDLILFPLDSHVFHGDKDLGQMPVSVYVKDGEELQLLVKRDGYWPRRLVVDGKKQRIVVGLYKYNYNRPASEQQAPEQEEGAEPEVEPNFEKKGQVGEASQDVSTASNANAQADASTRVGPRPADAKPAKATTLHSDPPAAH